jgi:hypothetical protein
MFSDWTMRRLISIVVLSATLPATAAGQRLPRTPEPGSPERTAILDAVRPTVERQVDAHVTFADVRLSVHDGWAYFRAIPYAREESREEARSDLRIPCEDCDPFVFALLRQDAAGWRMLEARVGAPPASSPLAEWTARHGAPAALAYRDPDDAALEAAMREYIDALAARDDRRFLALFTRTTPVLVVDNIESPAHVGTLTAAEMARDFRKRDGWYHVIFGENVDPVTGDRELDYYAEGFDNRMMWRRHGPGLYVKPWSSLDDGLRRMSYVRWKKDGGRWVVEEIGHFWS